MKEFIPVPGTVKARLLEIALKEFGVKGYEGVNVTDLAKQAGATTGAIYHHFESKLGLYRIVREEMERRIVDRMEGAAAAFGDQRDHAVRAALLVGFDAAVRFEACRMVSEADPSGRIDLVARLLEQIASHAPKGVHAILAAAWRAALSSAADGMPPEEAKRALEWLISK